MASRSKVEIALLYASMGWRVFPAKNKKPITPHGLLDGTTDEEKIHEWFDKARVNVQIGITTGRMSNLVVLDVDTYKPGGEKSFEALKTIEGFNAETFVCVTGRNGLQYYYKYPAGQSVVNAQTFMGLDHVDVRGEGGYVVAPGSPGDDGQFYHWQPNHSPEDVTLADCPPFMVSGKSKAAGTKKSITLALNGVPQTNLQTNGNHHTEETTLITEGRRNETLTSVAGTFRNFGMSEEAIYTALQEVNHARCNPPLPDEEVHVIASHITAYPPHRNRNDALNDIGSEEAGRTFLTFDRNDAGFGQMIAFNQGAKIRFNHTKAAWLLWQGHFWVSDEKEEIFLRAIDVADRFRAFANIIADEQARNDAIKYARQLKNQPKLQAGLHLASVQPGVATVHSEWDNNPAVIAALNGVIDLRDGSIRNGRPEDCISQWVNIEYDPEATCPQWISFLSDIFNADDELLRFVQKAVGYSLTGETREQCLFMLIGKGANGKTTFLEILRILFNGYAFSAPFSTFERSNNAQQQSNDLAAIANKRLVMASEPNEGVILNEGRIKSLTGGESISARFLHQEFFQFVPICKIWLAANTLPRVVDDSFGFWRRVRMIRFTRQFVNAADITSPDQRAKDPELLFKLMSELPGVLNWAIAGAQMWYREALKIPAAVAVVTDQYRVDSDPLHDFISQHCMQDGEVTVNSDELYKAYTNFCSERMMKHFEIMSASRFHSRMSQKYEKYEMGGASFYRGISLQLASRHLTSTEVQSVVLHLPQRKVKDNGKS